MKKLKLVIGLIFISISILGLYPILKTSVFSGQSNNIQKTFTGMAPPRTRIESNKDITDTNYPIFVGLFAVSGALLLSSIKNEN